MRRSLSHICALLAGAAAFVHDAAAQPFSVQFPRPSLDRWMYPFNVSPGTRPAASVFGTFGDESGVDTRHAQFLLGFDTASQIATNRGPSSYLITRARVTVTLLGDRTFQLDPTQDAWTTYFETNHPAWTPDEDAGRPVELFGTGFRSGYTAESFLETSPFGSAAAGGRNAYSAGYSTNGLLVDVGNNVGKAAAEFPSFEAHPFAVGNAANLAPGELVPTGTALEFDLNLSDPLVLQYLQEGCHNGRLRFAVTGMHVSEFGGNPAWPNFYTQDNILGEPPTFIIEGAAISGADTDDDSLPDDWEQFYFGSLAQTASGDADGDGQSNLDEFHAGSSPANPAARLEIIAIERGPSGATLRFPHAASRRYLIEWSNDLAAWTRVENPAVEYYAAPGVAAWKDTDTEGASAMRFYRVFAQ